MPTPTISNNGYDISGAQAEVVRIALNAFREQHSDPNSLGSDALGRAMVKEYYNRASEVLQLIHSAPKSHSEIYEFCLKTYQESKGPSPDLKEAFELYKTQMGYPEDTTT